MIKQMKKRRHRAINGRVIYILYNLDALSKINTATPEMKIKLIMRANFR